MRSAAAITLRLPPHRLALVLLGLTACLLAAQVAVAVIQSMGYDHAMGLVGLFDFDYESNAPTLFGSILHVLAAVACAANWAIARHFRLVWLVGVGLFLFFGVDETYGIHEPLIFVLKGGISDTTAHIRNLLGVTFAEIWPYLVVFGMVVLLALLPFVRSLDRRILGMVGGGLSLFFLGAVMIDTFVANLGDSAGWSWTHELLAWAEELAEMVGMVIVIYGLHRNLELVADDVSVSLTR